MDKSDMENYCNTLRLELKAWEKSFVKQHDGRKAGRDDIKANASISLKYKEYNKLRDTLSGKTAPKTPSKRTATRKPVPAATPKAQQQNLNVTPSKRKHDSVISFEDIVDAESSPQGPQVIGPTPQRDGIVLGLFDLLPSETPSKRRAVLSEITPNAPQTPRKNHGWAENDISIETRMRGERTPPSIGKRFMLDKFVTPQKRKKTEEDTPLSLKGLTTPAFLRRNAALDVVDEDHEPTPRPAPWKRRPMGRSLSSMIQALKKKENDRLDEEAEIMREMEMEAEGITVPKKPKVAAVLVEDSQVVMPLGPDRGEESDDDDDDVDENELKSGLDRDGNPRKVWKKKGLKRQTKRVIMRPHFVKPLAPDAHAQQEDADSGEEVGVAETQLKPTGGDQSEHDFSSTDDVASDYASDCSHTPKKRKTLPKASKPAEPAAKPDSKEKTNTDGLVKAVARKIKATAHANYRKLKIKGTGGSGKGRFGRKR